MAIARPIPFSIEKLESIFTLDRLNGRLNRIDHIHERKNSENYKTDYRYVSIGGVQYPEHRLIWMLANEQPIPFGMDVDHINRNKLDNRPENLRLATTAQNRANISRQRNNKTGYKGVFFDKGKFRAKIKSKGVQYFLGSYSTAEAAAVAYDIAALAKFGEYSMTNAQMGLLAA